ncbi:hypothetical protein [Succinimonas amylolytica]|uniref:hypothetical protein n=1 Tax=Succinimonas amylolytica TaxID=83769 RepID=UPI00037EC528|nr:hypothetical protein [Succinimonas amylolytica]
MFFEKLFSFGGKKPAVTPYDKTREKPLIRVGCCTGEKMAGFRSLENGRFREIMLIQSDRDYQEFLRRYAVDPRDVDQDVLES